MAKTVLKIMNSLVGFVIVLALCLAGAYSVYALWDNGQVYAAAENVQADMLRLKSTPDQKGGASFAELLAINPDVCAWVTLDNTKIDHPVLQGETNLSYINTDVYGSFALAGSIFLDATNNRGFTDAYSLLYGHHMEGGRMFGDLDLFKDERFFGENESGTLLLPDRTYELEIFACLLVPASEDAIFLPSRWRADIEGLLAFVEANAMHLRQGTVDRLRSADSPQVLAFSTCATDYTDARTVILAAMKPRNDGEIGG